MLQRCLPVMKNYRIFLAIIVFGIYLLIPPSCSDEEEIKELVYAEGRERISYLTCNAIVNVEKTTITLYEVATGAALVIYYFRNTTCDRPNQKSVCLDPIIEGTTRNVTLTTYLIDRANLIDYGCRVYIQYPNGTETTTERTFRLLDKDEGLIRCMDPGSCYTPTPKQEDEKHTPCCDSKSCLLSPSQILKFPKPECKRCRESNQVTKSLSMPGYVPIETFYTVAGMALIAFVITVILSIVRLISSGEPEK